MGSFNGKGRHQGRDLRRGTKGRRLGFLKLESLEERVLLASTPWQPTSSNLADIQAGPMANAGQDLINVYLAYQSGGAATVASQYSAIKFQAGSVGIDTNWNGSRRLQCLRHRASERGDAGQRHQLVVRDRRGLLADHAVADRGEGSPDVEPAADLQAHLQLRRAWRTTRPINRSRPTSRGSRSASTGRG